MLLPRQGTSFGRNSFSCSISKAGEVFNCGRRVWDWVSGFPRPTLPPAFAKGLAIASSPRIQGIRAPVSELGSRSNSKPEPLRFQDLIRQPNLTQVSTLYSMWRWLSCWSLGLLIRSVGIITPTCPYCNDVFSYISDGHILGILGRYIICQGLFLVLWISSEQDRKGPSSYGA